MISRMCFAVNKCNHYHIDVACFINLLINECEGGEGAKSWSERYSLSPYFCLLVCDNLISRLLNLTKQQTNWLFSHLSLYCKFNYVLVSRCRPHSCKSSKFMTFEDSFLYLIPISQHWCVFKVQKLKQDTYASLCYGCFVFLWDIYVEAGKRTE